MLDRSKSYPNGKIPWNSLRWWSNAEYWVHEVGRMEKFYWPHFFIILALGSWFMLLHCSLEIHAWPRGYQLWIQWYQICLVLQPIFAAKYVMESLVPLKGISLKICLDIFGIQYGIHCIHQTYLIWYTHVYSIHHDICVCVCLCQKWYTKMASLMSASIQLPSFPAGCSVTIDS